MVYEITRRIQNKLFAGTLDRNRTTSWVHHKLCNPWCDWIAFGVHVLRAKEIGTLGVLTRQTVAAANKPPLIGWSVGTVAITTVGGHGVGIPQRCDRARASPPVVVPLWWKPLLRRSLTGVCGAA